MFDDNLKQLFFIGSLTSENSELNEKVNSLEKKFVEKSQSELVEGLIFKKPIINFV